MRRALLFTRVSLRCWPCQLRLQRTPVPLPPRRTLAPPDLRRTRVHRPQRTVS
jgi:hypothetical protein